MAVRGGVQLGAASGSSVSRPGRGAFGSGFRGGPSTQTKLQPKSFQCGVNLDEAAADKCVHRGAAPRCTCALHKHGATPAAPAALRHDLAGGRVELCGEERNPARNRAFKTPRQGLQRC